MNEAQINTLLQSARRLSDLYAKQGREECAKEILRLTSLIVLPYLPKSYKVICRCQKQLRTGYEITFFNQTGFCYDCDSSLTDIIDTMPSLEEMEDSLDTFISYM